MVPRKHQLFYLALALILMLSALGAYSPAAAPGGAEVRLSFEQPAYSADQPVIVQVTVSNPTGKPVKVLKWYTPVEDVEEPLFSVTLDGQHAAYLGAIYKRPAPTGEDYVTLKPGDSFTKAVDLAAYYDLSASGSYSISYAVASPDLYSEKGSGVIKKTERIVSNEVTVWVEGRASGPVLQAITPELVSGTTTFTKCTTTQQTTATSARSNASTYAADALGYLTASKQGPRYTTWFGVYDSTRYATVKNHFAAISNAMDTKTVNIDCSCKKNYYAYVYPTKPYVIYVCKVFWTAPMTGTDSKAGTLIHEMSHFNVVASTDDYVYGQSGAKSLAISNPSQAINNADNHEYFAENTPTLP